MFTSELNVSVRCDEEGKKEINNAITTLDNLRHEIMKIVTSCDASDDLHKAIIVLNEILEGKPIY